MYIIFRRIIPFFARAFLTCLFISFFMTLLDIYYSTKSPSTMWVKVTDIVVIPNDFNELKDKKSLKEAAYVTMDINADFSSMFTFNTKTIFVSVVVEYETSTHNRNQVMLWSTVITNSATSRIKSLTSNKQYSLDDDNSFNGVNGTYLIEWSVIPKIGVIRYGRADSNDEKFILNFPKIDSQSTELDDDNSVN